MTAPFRTDLPDRLPLPLARLYRRARNATSWMERHANALYLLEATVELAAAAHVACYLAAGDVRREAIDGRLRRLALPSPSDWGDLLSEVSAATASLDPHPFPALAGASESLGRVRDDLPALRSALAAMRRHGGDGTAPPAPGTRILDLVNRLPRYREEALGRAPRREEAFHAEMAKRLIEAAVEWHEKSPPLGAAALAYVADVRDVSGPGGESRAELWDLTGSEAVRATAPGGETLPDGVRAKPRRLYLRQGGRLLDLHPFAIAAPGPPDVAVRFLRRSEVDPRLEYLDYVTGDASLPPECLADLRALLGRVLGRSLSEHEFERIQSEGREDAAPPEEEDEVPAARRFGDFVLLAKIGAGGMGTVYLARQRTLGRLVALKLLPPGLSDDEVAAARFRREIQAMARADHPHVVRILQSGRTDGTHWFAMEYVDGADLRAVTAELPDTADRSTLADRDVTEAVRTIVGGKREQVRSESKETIAGLSPAPRSTLPELGVGTGYYARVAEATRDAALGLQHLHERGVLHRDVKPANVMLTRDEGRAVVMDLGLARLAGEASMTRPATMLGTLQYAAPEQLRAGLLKLDARADVYGLGATLYELTTGRPPFEAETTEALIALVLRTEPAPPRRVDRSVPADLDAIVRKAMDRDPERRYSSMAAFADDLTRFAEGEPVSARPPGLGTLTRLWIRRHAAVAATAAAALLVIVVGTILFVRSLGEQRDRAEYERDRARSAEHRALEGERRVTDHLISGYAWRAKETGSPVVRLLYAARAVDLGDRPDARGLLLDAAARVRRAQWSTHRSVSGLLATAYSPDGSRLATGGDAARLWDLETGALLAEMSAHPGIVVDVAFDGVGSRLACADDDGSLRVWDTARPRLAPLSIADAHDGAVRRVTFLPDGRHLASAGMDGAVALWTLDGKGGFPEEIKRWKAHLGPVPVLCASPDGRRLVSGGKDGKLRVWDVGSEEVAARLDGTHESRLVLAAFRRGGEELVSVDAAGQAAVWDSATWGTLRTLGAPGARVTSAALSPVGELLATGREDGTLILLDFESDEPVSRIDAHDGGVTALAFSSDGRQIASGSVADVSLRLWDVTATELAGEIRGHGQGVVTLAVGRDGALIASAGQDGAIHFWDARTGRRTDLLRGPYASVLGLALSPREPQVASGDQEGVIRLWSLEERTQREWARRDGEAFAVAYDQHGNRLFSTGAGGRVEIWNAADGKLERTLSTPSPELYALSVGPGRAPYVAAGGTDGHVYLWEVATGREAGRLSGHDDEVSAVAFSPGGVRLASASSDRTVRVWERESGREIARLEGHDKQVAALAYAPDGRHLASGGWDRTIRIWDLATFEEVARLEGHDDVVWTLAYAPDGKSLLSGSRDGTLRKWDAAPPPPHRLRVHPGRIRAVAIARDGRRLLTGGDDATVRIWDLETGDMLHAMSGHTQPVNAVLFVAGDRMAISVCADWKIRTWDAAGGRPVRTYSVSSTYPWAADTAGDGRELTVACEDAAYLLDVDSGTVLRRLAEGDRDIVDVAVAPDGRSIATCRIGRTVAEIWDLETGEPIRMLAGHGAGVWALDWAPSGGRIATASLDGTLRVWDANTGETQVVLEGHEAPAMCVDFDPSGALLVSGSTDRTVRVWDLADRREVARFTLDGDQVEEVVFGPNGRRVVAAGTMGSAYVFSLERLDWPSGSCRDRAERATEFRLEEPFEVVPPPPSHLRLLRR